MWSYITASVLKIVEYILAIFYKRSQDKSITNNELSKKLSKESDEHKEMIKDALEGDKDALDKIRKHISL